MSLSQEPTPVRSLLVSVLSLGRTRDVLALLNNLPGWLGAFAQSNGIQVHLVVRNHDPRVDFDEVGQRLAQCEAEQPGLSCQLVTGIPNLGFGRGHNENYRSHPADYLLILNDDIGFPHIDWLPQAVSVLARDPQIACVAASENPRYLNPMFGHGQATPALAVETLKYAEASVALFNGRVFERLGMFDERLEWAMCEDADLSLRAQQLGYRLHWMAMPHEHWRSTSVNTLPASVRSSILEHNRASLFAAWSQTLATGRIGRWEVFDLWSDGMGDVFCALPHLRAWTETLPPDRRQRIIINTGHRQLVELMGFHDIRTICEADRNDLVTALDAEGVTALHSMRDINYSLPINLHPLVCGALGVPMSGEPALEAFRASLRVDRGSVRTSKLTAPYCVVHLEFTRAHQGRSLGPASMKTILQHCTRLFETVVLVGNERRLSLDPPPKGSHVVIDLQGRLTLPELIDLIAHAGHFVGIDSFPAHVAQAAGVRSAIFFGSVHPMARVWDERMVWPLVADLDCIGCYHTHLESSAPFCMRRDEACTHGPDVAAVERILQSMLRGEPYHWAGLRQRFEALQAKWFGFLRHHPSPPHRLMRPEPTANEQVSNLLYRMLDEAAELVGTRYRTTTVTGLTERVRELESELFAREVELDELRQSRRRLGQLQQPTLAEARLPVRIVPIATLPLQLEHGTIDFGGEWLNVQTTGEDPQLRLPQIRSLGGRVKIRLDCVADRADTMQVYWIIGEGEFTEDRQQATAVSPQATSAEMSFDLAAEELLRLRIDPLMGRGRLRLRGSISGAFDIVEAAPNNTAELRPRSRKAAVPKRDRQGKAREAASTGNSHGNGRRRQRRDRPTQTL